MSKRNHIVERASDVNGGQYIQTNPSYNSGYEDGKKAGKEYCASEITTLREQVEKLTKERNAFQDQCIRLKNERAVENGQLAALAEQNEKQRAFLEFAWKDIPMNEYAFKILEHTMNLPNLSSPVLNRIRAEAYREAACIAVEWGNGRMDDHGGHALRNYAAAIRARADELEQSNG